MNLNEMYIVHYFDTTFGPFKNLSSLSVNEAQKIHDEIIQNKNCFASKRQIGYYNRRKELEKIAYDIFLSKGGTPKSIFPHYFCLEECDWVETWYQSPNYLKVKISQLNIDEMSFTYGDLFPTFSEKIIDNKEYRRNVYTCNEIMKLINKYGLPQDWNNDGKHGPERYIEVHYWNNNLTEIMNKGIYKL
jgi:hypothetical protein